MLWNEVLTLLRMSAVRSMAISAIFYALQDYCAASGKELALMDRKFAERNPKYAVACFYKNNREYMFDIPDVGLAEALALHKTDGLAIIPVSVGVELREIAVSIAPEHAYPDCPTQCRGFNLSLIDDE